MPALTCRRPGLTWALQHRWNGQPTYPLHKYSCTSRGEKAGDLLVYTTEIVNAMESIGRQLNPLYFAVCQLAMNVNGDKELIELVTKAAMELSEA